jgi:hypothetical protein
MAQRRSIADFEAAMASIPKKTGYAYKQWRHGINAMIPKKVDSIRADKLRTIVLFVSDFNYTDKAIGEITAKRAKQNRTRKALPKNKAVVIIISVRWNWLCISC